MVEIDPQLALVVGMILVIAFIVLLYSIEKSQDRESIQR